MVSSSSSTTSIILLFYIIQIIHGQFLLRDEIDELRIAIMDQIDRFSNEFTSKEEKPLAASIIRLTFHDCAGPVNMGTTERTVDTSIRKCDGCINLDLGDHRGLEQFAIDPLEKVFEHFSDRINRADFWAAAGNIALEYTHFLADNNDELPDLAYFFGRPECPLSPDALTTNIPGTEFPLAHLGWDPAHEFFEDAFDFTVEETTAILGAHTLGKAHPTASGFDGKWTSTPFHFNNEFYKQLLDSRNQWDQTGRQQSGFPQWESNGRTNNGETLMMLTADMSLILAMEEPEDHPNINERTGVVTCRAPDFNLRRMDTCEEEVSTELVERFANNNQEFLNSFVEAWNKILLNNQGRLTRVRPNPFRDFRNDNKETPLPTRSPQPRPTPRPTRSPQPRPTPRPTRSPQPRPTPRPTQPTPRPTQPTPRPTQPTPRPTQPTPKPSRQPTPRPPTEPRTKRPTQPLPSTDGPFCCVANFEPNWNGRCWGATDERSCDNIVPVGERCHWDPSNCRRQQTCLLRDVDCSSNLQCCSGRCRPNGMCR
eukprot:535252_1